GAERREPRVVWVAAPRVPVRFAPTPLRFFLVHTVYIYVQHVRFPKPRTHRAALLPRPDDPSPFPTRYPTATQLRRPQPRARWAEAHDGAQAAAGDRAAGAGGAAVPEEAAAPDGAPHDVAV
uniref:Uncharacterized protein n=1 Tax=Aegilops tauschii subsp. strangulata TaxID=200361 RepID=A0A453LY91_AEGTS